MVTFIRNLKASEFGMRIREKLYLINAPATNLHLKQAMERYQNCTHKKSPTQIKKEIEICEKFWKCYPYHYFIQNLFMADHEVTKEELINYIPQYYWFKLFIPHYFSPKFSIIGDNKIILKQFFEALKINQPKTSIILFNGFLYTSNMERITFQQAQQMLVNNNYEKLFVKPADGSGGKGIYIFHKNNQQTYITKQNIFFNENFLTTIGKKNDYIIQPGVIQDPEISQIYPDSVNTCRIITENKNGESRAVCAMLRVGRYHKEVDNISSGGISTNINILNGKFGDFAITYQGEKFERHPDTQFIFRNNQISRWDEILEFATQSAEKMPFFTYLGWDISLTSEGPVAIETNSGPAVDIIEMTAGGLREAFGIDDPDYFWKNPGKRLQ